VRPDTTLRILNDDGTIDEADPLIASSHPITIQRLKDRRPSTMESMLAASRAMGVAMSVLPSAWTMDEVAGPNITDKATVLTLATIASNAYIQHQNSSDWVDVGGGFNRSLDIGWESDGLRGHVFTDEDESIVVIGIKGTSAGR
jgi:lipase ATG15